MSGATLGQAPLMGQFTFMVEKPSTVFSKESFCKTGMDSGPYLWHCWSSWQIDKFIDHILYEPFMGKSETALLRREVVKMMTEIKRLQGIVVRVEAERDRIRADFEDRIDMLMERIAGQEAAKYENSNAPPSTDSIYNRERDAFRKRRTEEEGHRLPVLLT